MFGTQGIRFNQVDSTKLSFFCSQFNLYLLVQSAPLAGDLLTVRPRKAQQAVAVPLPSLKPDTITEAKHHAAGWDIYVLEDEWRNKVADKKIKVSDADADFIKFCRKRGPYKQGELF